MKVLSMTKEYRSDPSPDDNQDDATFRATKAAGAVRTDREAAARDAHLEAIQRLQDGIAVREAIIDELRRTIEGPTE